MGNDSMVKRVEEFAKTEGAKVMVLYSACFLNYYKKFGS